MSHLVLRNVIEDDLPIFFKHQQDSEANQMAAFTSKDLMIGIALLNTGTKYLRIRILLSKRFSLRTPLLAILYTLSSLENQK